MARSKRRSKSIEPAQRVLFYIVPPGESYIDLAKNLSEVNRRFYRQGMSYGIGKIEFSYSGKPGSADVVHLTAYTAGSTWVVHNAWKKAQAYWLQQQRRARRLIGAGAKPAYEDFKVYLDDSQRVGTTLPVIASDAGAVGVGEWEHSVFHVEAEDHSIEEYALHIIGNDIGSTDKGLILAYQNSRATVQAESPDLPTEYSANLYAQLADDLDDVAAHVADDMEDENDEPPYDRDDYPGSDTNSDRPWIQETQAASFGSPNATLDGFVAQCGLIMLNNQGYSAAGGAVTAPPLAMTIHLVPGNYKGILAEPMGQ
jgi:hypothetical protein